MSKSSQIAQFITKYFWPPFRDFIWPIIKDEVISIIKITFKDLQKQYEEILTERGRKREEEVKRKAQEAEEQANKAKDKAEAEYYKKLADVWHGVFEEFRQDNELLKEKLAAATRAASQEAEQKVQSIRKKPKDKPFGLPEPSDNLTALSDGK